MGFQWLPSWQMSYPQQLYWAKPFLVGPLRISPSFPLSCPILKAQLFFQSHLTPPYVLLVKLLSGWPNLFFPQSQFLPSQLPKCWHSQCSHLFSAATPTTMSYPPPLWPLPWDASDVSPQVPKLQATQDSALSEWFPRSLLPKRFERGDT